METNKTMKLPFTIGGSGSYYNHNESPLETDEVEIDRQDDGLDVSVDDDFTEYLWMENEEEFDKLEWQRLEEEELMKQCIDDYENDEDEENDTVLTMWSQHGDAQEICQFMSMLEVNPADIENSTLNPFAAEFVPASAGN